MAIKISLDHPTFTLREKVQEINKTFLADYGFSYFQYLRCFDDGSISLLTNNTGLIEYFQHVDNSPVVFSSFNNDYENSHSYWFLWDEVLPKFPVQLAREKFHFHNGITLVRRSRNYYDMIAVALSAEQANAGSFYLNKLKIIEHYINDFDKQNKELITLINNNKIILPSSYRDVNYQKICLTKGRITVTGKEGLTYITSQELACLRLLLQGASYKEAAKLLHLSSRTVETYIDRIKQRTGFFSRSEIERALLCP
ncbi:MULTISPECIES: helix-turn-helix transcriptional regulator [unclassified Legionella]|uniref:helix-turn-helix transcriptional regulator n=1 Tax=unclassified Legionella TaxID=2622702 RepID=UPI001E581468|nr:helix-turn-helix transcriptional regulator [Legionella sp. 31fI33]MCC5014032.1 helix-turn-helix transcriptional regulator [Legionella sp. 31fI33]